MTYATQLARIAAIVSAVGDIGRVHSWPRFGDAAEHYVTTVDGIRQIRGWEIGLDDTGIEGQRVTEAHAAHYTNWRIRGYLSLADEAASYNTIIALAEQIRAGLEADPTLAGACLDMVGENQGSPDISPPDNFTIGGGHLCWTITIGFTTYDIGSI